MSETPAAAAHHNKLATTTAVTIDSDTRAAAAAASAIDAELLPLPPLPLSPSTAASPPPPMQSPLAQPIRAHAPLGPDADGVTLLSDGSTQPASGARASLLDDGAEVDVKPSVALVVHSLDKLKVDSPPQNDALVPPAASPHQQLQQSVEESQSESQRGSTPPPLDTDSPRGSDRTNSTAHSEGEADEFLTVILVR